MKYKNIVIFLPFILLLLYSSFSLHIVSAHASTADGILLHIDNQRKVAYPNNLVQFDITVANNGHDRETFIIRYAWENSVLWLPMDTSVGDDNQKVYDSSSFGNHGTLKNFDFHENNGCASGHFGVALSFDGVDDYIQIDTDESLDLSDAFTVEAWINSTWKVTQAIIDKGGSGARNYALYLTSSGIAYTTHNATGEIIKNYTYSYDENTWYHLVFTADGTTMKLYVNGNFEDSIPAAGLYTTYPSLPLEIGRRPIEQDYLFKGIIDEVRIYNRALSADEIGWLYNGSWSENLGRYEVGLGPGENTQATFSVKVPQGAMPAHAQKFLLTAFPQSNPRYRKTETVTVEVLEHNVAVVSLDESEKSGKPGDIINFDAVVRNWGNVEDTYDISVEDDGGWDISFSPESIVIPPGEACTVTISVAAPPEARPGDFTSFKVQAASRGDPGLVEQVEGTAVAIAIYDFSITAHPELGQGSPGSEVSFSLELKNFGTAPDTFDLEVERAVGWDIEVDPSSLSLENGEAGKVAVRMKVPEDALVGQLKRVTIQAVSRGDPGVSAECAISVEVVTPFWERPDVIFLVGLIVGVLVGATLIGSIILRRAPIVRRRSRKG